MVQIPSDGNEASDVGDSLQDSTSGTTPTEPVPIPSVAPSTQSDSSNTRENSPKDVPDTNNLFLKTEKSPSHSRSSSPRNEGSSNKKIRSSSPNPK